MAKNLALNRTGSHRIDESEVPRYLGPVKYLPLVAQKSDEVGVATALAWTPVGGEILFVEAIKMPGHGRLQLTGNLGAVMQESAQAALSYVRSQSQALGIPEDLFERVDIHIHLPEGAIPKDGPSAGIALAKGSRGEITLLTVFNHQELSDGGRVNILPPDVLEREKEIIRRRVGARLDDYALDFLETGLEVRKLLRKGNPREEIINVAREIEADAIVIGAHSRRSIFDVLLGKTAESITKNAPCAVVKVSPPPRAHWRDWDLVLTRDH